MLRWILESGQKVRLLVVTLAVAVMVLGAWRLPQAPKEMLPEFGPVYVEVQTEALGLSATEVEDLITVPLEQNLLNGVAWLQDIHSQSITGLSSIVLIFEPGTDPLRARQMVAERLTQAFALPDVSKPPQMLQPLSSSSRVIMIGLSSQELSQMETSVVARWTIRPALMGVPGVANVSIWGHREQQLQVQVDPERLRENNVLLEDVIATTGNALWVSPLTFLEASAPGTGGFIDTPNQRIGVQHLFPIGSPEELALVPVEGCESQYGSADEQGPVRCPTLGDVATIQDQHQPLIGDSITAQEGDILLVIEKFPDASTEQVVQDVRDKLDDLAPGLGGIAVDTSLYQRENLIQSAMDNLSQLLILGGVLAVVIIGLLLFDWRSAVIALVTIPLSLTAGALILEFVGASLNIIVISGLIVALGVVIDDAVTDTENIRRRVREWKGEGDGRPTAAMVVDAALETRRPIVASTAFILLAASPILLLGGMFDSFYLGGQSRAFLDPLFVGYAIAVVVSLAVSLVVTPTVAAIVYSRYDRPRTESAALRAAKDWYASFLHRVGRRPGLAAGAAALLLIVGMVLLPQLEEPEHIIPDTSDRDLLVTWNAAPGTSLPEMDRITSLMTGELQGLSGIRNVSAHVGRAITSDQIVDVHAGEIWVSIDPSADYEQTVASVEGVVAGYPGISHDVHTFIEDRLAQVESTTDGSVVVRIYGQDMEQLQASAVEVQAAMQGVDGISRSRIDLPAMKPQLQVEVDLAAAQEYGLSPGAVRRTAATLVTGLEVGSLFEEQKVFEVMVVGVPEVRESISSIEDILIDTPDGEQVRLGDVASVQLAPTSDSVTHESVSRFVDVVAVVGDRNRSSVAEELQERLATVSFPFEYHAEVLGDFAEQEDAETVLLRGTVVMVVIGYLILQAIFSSWRLATLAFVSIPVSLVGGIVAISLIGGEVTLGALLGLVAILAISVRSVVLLISRFEEFRVAGARPNIGTIQQGAQERMVPMLVTSLATLAAFLPFAFVGPDPGLELVHPMSLVILGGMVTSTLVSVFLVPSLYLWFAPVSSPAPVREQDFVAQPAD